MPEIPLVSGSEVKIPVAKTADDINDLFKSLDSEDDVKKIKEPSSSEAEVEADDDLDLVEPDEDIDKIDLTEKEDDLNINAPPRKKEILKKYPELFKDFPFMEKILYRDKQYNELFGSFDDAKEIAEKAEHFSNFESQLLAGNTEEVLRGVKDADSKAFDNIVDNYLGTLAKVDKDAYFEVVGNLNKRLIVEMVKEANETGNDDLKQAALLINQFVFGSVKFTEPTRRVNKSENEETSKVEQERLDLTRERFESSRDELQTRVDNTLKATIAEYIDPKGVMSSYVKKNAVVDAIRILNSSIGSDTAFAKNLDKLWRSAFDSKFSRESLSKIQTTYLGRAKSSLKNAIIKARAEALKDVSPREKPEKEETEIEDSPRQRRTIPTGRPSQPRSKNEMKKGESVADFFARD
jgi:hypothetical protein